MLFGQRASNKFSFFVAVPRQTNALSRPVFIRFVKIQGRSLNKTKVYPKKTVVWHGTEFFAFFLPAFLSSRLFCNVSRCLFYRTAYAFCFDPS